MIVKTQLITLHAQDFLDLLGVPPNEVGSLTLRDSDGDEVELDLSDLCMVVRIESEVETVEHRADRAHVIPMIR